MTVELTLSEKRLELKVESEFLCPLCKSLLYFGIQNQLEICPNSTCSNNPKDYRFADKSKGDLRQFENESEGQFQNLLRRIEALDRHILTEYVYDKRKALINAYFDPREDSTIWNSFS